MKKILTLIAFLPTLGFAQICNPNGNIVIFSNYDGGILNIDVDVDIPNLKIGIISYEGVTINLSGAYVNNVTGVEYAGYNANNAHCGPAINTSINGAPGGATTNIVISPPAGLSNPNGYGNIICAYSCNNGANQGGCNTVDQVEDYFITLFNGTLYSHTVQYSCWSGNQAISTAGNCCPVVPFTTTPSGSGVSCNAACDGTASVVVNGGTAPYTYSWSPGSMTTSSVSGLCAGTYTITVTDNTGGTVVNSVTIAEPPAITSSENIDVCSGESHTYPDGTTSSNITANESHTSTLTAANGCDSTVVTNINVLALPDNTITTSGLTLFSNQQIATYQWLDCNNGNAPISGETGQSFTATTNGSYAVEVTYNGCTVTSSCTEVNQVGIIENSFEASLSVFPNPTDGQLSIVLGKPYENLQLELTDLSGKNIWNQSFTQNSVIDLEINEPAGAYILILTSGSERAMLRLVKK